MSKDETKRVELALTGEELGLSEETLIELEEAISEKISDMTEYCHLGFAYRIVVVAELDISE